MRWLLVLLASTLALAACDPATATRLALSGEATWAPDGATGHVLCDRQPDIVAEITDQGWTVDCAPDFPAVRGDTGAPIWGWTDQARRTVWLWPERWGMDDVDVRVGLFHELHHVLRPGSSEADAMLYSFCRERPPGGFTLLSATPTNARCEAVGA